jgi:hypothetical protein
MHSIGLDVHKETISYCEKDAAGHVHREGKDPIDRARVGFLDPAWTSTPLRTIANVWIQAR